MEAPINTAFVLAAGLGTRLRPLTTVCPKPMLPIFGKPLITFALDHLRSIGVRSFVINTHHLPAQFAEYFAPGEYAGSPVKLVHEPDVLETGGGIKNAEQWIGNETFIVYSGDILTDFDIGALVEEHFRRKNDVTLALRKTGLSTAIALEDHKIVDIKGKYGRPGEYDFANVSVWNSGIFQRIPPGKKIAFIPVLADWIAQGGRIGGLAMEDRQWFNIGSHKEYIGVHRYIAEKSWKPAYVSAPDWPVSISPTASIAPSASLFGFNSVGGGCVVGENAIMEDCILWHGAKVAPNAHLSGCVLAGNLSITGRHDNVDFTNTP